MKILFRAKMNKEGHISQYMREQILLIKVNNMKKGNNKTKRKIID